MSVRWEDLDARARGLGTHLLGRQKLEELAQAADLAELAVDLERAGYTPGPAARGSPAALEAAVRRGAAARLRVLIRWAGERVRLLAALFEDEDRRSLRALLRGAVAGAPPESRLAGLLPTPELPERALRELARQPTPAAVADLLTAWGNPYGPPLREEASRPHPDLFHLESLLGREYAGRAVAASREGGRELSLFVREGIDLENAASALLLAGAGADVDPASCFLPGGRLLSVEPFLAAATAGDRREAARRLAHAFRRTPYAEVFRRRHPETGSLEAGLLAARLRKQAEAARRRPLGPAPLLAYLLRLRAEVMDLRRLLWGVALGAPRERLIEELVT